MPSLLAINVSPRGDYSVSRNLANQFVAAWEKNHSGGSVVSRDLAKTDLPFVDLPWIAGAYSSPDQHTPEQKAALAISDTLIAELFAADEILIATPMYNFNVPASLKAWIDHVVRIGKTFTSSYEGLVKGKKVTVILASGSDYSPSSPMAGYNSESGYLKQILGFIGIQDVSIVMAGGSGAVSAGKVSLEDFLAPFEQPVVEAAK